MRVKVGETWYDGEECAVMVELTDKDRENIANMSPVCNRYCVYPDKMDADDVDKWMKDNGE